jgi:hypothetical protein
MRKKKVPRAPAQQMVAQSIVSQPTQAQTDEAATLNAFSPPVHSQVSPFVIDDDAQMASSKVEDFQITSLLMPYGKFSAEGDAANIQIEDQTFRSLSSFINSQEAAIK